MIPLIKIGNHVELHRYRTRDEPGFGLGRNGITGLSGGAASRARSVARATGHGDFNLPGKLDSRIVAAKGTCIARNDRELGRFGQQLSGVLAEGPAPVIFNYLGQVLWAIASLAPGTKPEFEPESWSLGSNLPQAKFQLQLKLANPRLFGQWPDDDELPTSPTTSTLINRGNFTATPVYTITGYQPAGYPISGPDGRHFTVTRPLVDGEIHTVDMAKGYLQVNGNRVSGGVSSWDLWGIAGGASATASVPEGVVIEGHVYPTFI
jgi:hypothetical protein